ncbi:PP2C family protein-serine/threonine phosphatase [Sinosporangium album]|nr:PP2C family protein-serine/threonine phosphatase [Sinosporangium album]
MGGPQPHLPRQDDHQDDHPDGPVEAHRESGREGHQEAHREGHRAGHRDGPLTLRSDGDLTSRSPRRPALPGVGLDPEPMPADEALRLGGVFVEPPTSRGRPPRGPGLLPTQLTHAQRLGGMGWVEWNLRTGKGIWSEHVYVIFDRSPSDGPVRLHDLAAHVDPRDRTALDRLLWTAAQGREPVQAEFRIHPGAGARDVCMVLDAVFGPEGAATAVHGVVQDITERRSTERAMSEARARAAEERTVMLALRNAILPEFAPSSDLSRVKIAVRYVPAEQTARLGGDWYEAAPLPDGRLLLAVGDVSGHGLPAIAHMAKLRHALVGLTMTGRSADALLDWLNELVLHGAGASFEDATATAVVGHLDPASGVFTWAQAGHPAPILVRDGVARRLRSPSGILLGADRDLPYELARVRLRARDVLLLFTDGLVERRGRDIGVGLDLARRAAAEALAADPYGDLDGDLDGGLDRLLAAVGGPNPDDDACLLAVRLREGPRAVTMAACPV